MTPEERAEKKNEVYIADGLVDEIEQDILKGDHDVASRKIATAIRAAVEERESFLREQLRAAFQKDNDRQIEENRETVAVIKQLFGFDPETEPFTGVDPIDQAKAEAYADAEKILDEYGSHSTDCILSRWEAGEPTEGGYRTRYAGTWYQTKPKDETPKCNCGFYEAYEKIRARAAELNRQCDQYHCGHEACNKARGVGK